MFHLWEWLYSPVKALNLKEKILFFSLKILCACLNILIFIIAHRNLILPLYFYRYSSLEYSEERSFYDVDDNSFLFFFVLIVPLEKKPESSLFLSLFFSRSLSLFSLLNSNIIIMNNDGNHYDYNNHHSLLCTPTFHVDCTYLTREERDFLIVRLCKNENRQEKKI